MDKLIQLRENQLQLFQIYPYLVKEELKAERANMRKNPEIAQRMSDIEGSWFYKALREKNLPEDSDWSNRFATLKALGLSRFKVDDKGTYTNEVLTLNDIRQETLADLKKP